MAWAAQANRGWPATSMLLFTWLGLRVSEHRAEYFRLLTEGL
jgi:hypothetical protein